MDLTKVDRLIGWFGEKAYKPEYSRILGNIISGVSKDVELELRRHVSSEARTVNIDVERHDDVVFLRGFPIASVTSIKNDPSRDFGSGTEVDTDLYYIDTEGGVISFDFELDWGPGALRIVYEGGMAAGSTNAEKTDAFIAAYEDLVLAIDQQVFYEFQRRDNPGLENQNPSDYGGGSTYFVDTDWGEKHGEFLPKLVKAIERNMCKVRAW